MLDYDCLWTRLVSRENYETERYKKAISSSKRLEISLKGEKYERKAASNRLQLEKVHWKRKGGHMEKWIYLKQDCFFCLKVGDYYP